MNLPLVQHVKQLLRNRRIAAATAVAAVVIAGGLGTGLWLLLDDGGSSGTPPPPPGFSFSAEGEEVSRLAPIKLTFKEPPAERRAEKVLIFEPRPEGEYVWADDRTLLFQPKFPGLPRGQEYAARVPARPEAGLDNDFVRRFTTEGLLTVVSVIPAPNDVEVPAQGQVFVQFSRSVAPLTLISELSTKPVIEFTPPLQGKGEWLNTSLYRFIPESVPGNTTFRARIAAGLTSAADGVLRADYTWEFTTFSPAVTAVTPDANSKFASLRQPVTLTFNQKMERASVEAAFTLEAAAGAVPTTAAWTKDDTVVTFTPTNPLNQANVYTAVLAKGAKGATGGETQAERRAAFTTVGQPRVADTIPHNNEPSGGRFGVYIQFSNPMDPDSLEGKISVSGFSAKEINDNLYTDELNASVNLRLRPSTQYTAAIAAGATDRYGQPLPPYSWTFRTGGLESSLIFALPGQVATYSASQEPVLFFHTANMQSAVLNLYPLTKSERDSIQAANHLSFKETPFQPSLPARRTWTVSLPGTPDEVVLNSTSLSGGGPLPKGDYYVRWNGPRPQERQEFMFTVVDTAIVLKEASDELLAWALDLDTGQPIANLVLTATGVTGANQATTDASGLASFRLANDLDPYGSTRWNSSRVVRAEAGGRSGVANSNWQAGVELYQLGLPIDFGARRYVGYLYTERPIYRPGEEVHFKGVVRLDDDAAYTIPEAKPPIDVVVTSSQGKQLLREAVELNSVGTFAKSLKLPEGADTGDYGISLIWRATPNEFPVAGTSFLVAEFKRPEFQVEVAAAKPSYASGESIEASATASFFFGGAVSGAAVEWSVLSSPFAVQSKEFPFYSFADYDYFRYDIFNPSVVRDPVRANGTATTGADGVARFAVPAAIRGNEGAQQYTLSASVADTSGQVVAGSTTVSVHPASLYAGVRPAEYVATAGSPAEINLVTVDTEGNALPGHAVTVEVYERKWVTVKEATAEGARRYRSEPLDTLIETKTTQTGNKATGSVTITPKAAGTLRIVAVVTDERGRSARSAAYLWVSSGEFASWYVSNDDTIKLIADKESYEVGETATVLVPAPFSGSIGLVTTERGKIHTRAVQQFPTNSTQLAIPITARGVPDIFVSTVLYRPPTAEDPIPRYKVGYVELPVSTKTRELTVSIQPDRKQAKPGDMVRYDIRVTDSAGRGVKSEVSVAVVDKAVLSLAEERSTTGLKAFWYERGLGVRTSSSLAVSINRTNDVISEPQTGGKGGGGLDGERIRQDFKNTAYWNAQVATNDDGTATVQVPMPDNLTTWRMQVRAVSGDTMVGEGTNELLSTQPLLLRPALPRFLRVGDRVTLRLLVRNATEQAADVDVSLEAEGIELAGGTSRKTKVDPGQSTILEWPATVSAEGRAKLKFSAKSNTGLGDAVLQELPLTLDVTPETTATGGVVKQESLFEALYLPDYAILKGGELEIAVQPSLTGVLSGELPLFDRPFDPPYPSTSPLDWAARLIATAGVDRAEKSADPGTASPGRKSRVEGDLAALVSRQRSDGGWGWCTSCPGASDPWVTGWVLIAIGEARRGGFTFDNTSLNRAQSFIETELGRPADVKYPADPSRRAFFRYALAAAGGANAQLSTVRAMQEQYRAQLTNWGRAYLLLAMAEAGITKDDPQAGATLNDLITAVIPSANGNHWEDSESGGFGYTSVRTTSLVLQALVRMDPNHPLIEETTRWLMVARGTRDWEQSLNRAQGIAALSDFAASTGELAGDYDYAVEVGGKNVLSGHFKGLTREPAKKTVPLTSLEKGKITLLNFVRDSGALGRLYYTINLKYLTPAREVEALNRGMAVSDEYSLLGDPATKIAKAKLGQVVRVKVTVMTPGERDYVVVDDPLPAGLEPIDPSLKTTDPALIATLNAERDAANRPAGADYYAPWFGWYWNPFDQADLRDDRVTLRARILPKGVHEFIYYARATSVGDFFAAPAHAEESMFPEVFGRSDSGRFIVEP
ncbi:MAG: Ig-like domain-containing protein [Dehalococcoidia bacterium]